MDNHYWPIQPLFRFRTFAILVQTAISRFERDVGCKCTVNTQILETAFEIFRRSAREIVHEEQLSGRSKYSALLTSLVNGLAFASRWPQKSARRLVTMEFSHSADNVVHLDRHHMKAQSDELIAICVGASMYEAISKYRTRRDAECELSIPHALKCAAILQHEPIGCGQLMRTIKRPTRHHKI